MFGRKAHVNEVQVEGLAGGLAIFGRPVTVGLFMHLQCCYHIDLPFVYFSLSVAIIGSPGKDGRKPGKLVRSSFLTFELRRCVS
jgi:hypothetical protein